MCCCLLILPIESALKSVDSYVPQRKLLDPLFSEEIRHSYLFFGGRKEGPPAAFVFPRSPLKEVQTELFRANVPKFKAPPCKALPFKAFRAGGKENYIPLITRVHKLVNAVNVAYVVAEC